jgi:hypothetical protein
MTFNRGYIEVGIIKKKKRVAREIKSLSLKNTLKN